MKTETNRHIRTGCEKGSRHVTSRRHRWLPGLGRPSAPASSRGGVWGARGGPGGRAEGLAAGRPGPGRQLLALAAGVSLQAVVHLLLSVVCPQMPEPARAWRPGGGLGAPRRLLFFWNPRCRQPRTGPGRGGVCPRGLAPELTGRAGEGGPRTGQPPAGCGPLAHLTRRKQTAEGGRAAGPGAPPPTRTCD